MDIIDTPALSLPVSQKKGKKNPYYNKNNKFNGHLRTQKDKSYQNPRYFENQFQDDFSDEENSVKPPLSNELFYLLRQKHSHNNEKFFITLEQVLKEMEFNSIKSNEMGLFSYACVYEKNEIFDGLINKYIKFIDRIDFETKIIPLSLAKNIPLLKCAIQVFEQNFPIEESFVSHMLEVMARSSYREENNILIINWLENKFTDQQLDSFFHSIIEHKNLPLLTCSLNYNILKNYLKTNFNIFEPLLEKIGKNHEVKRKFGDEAVHPVIEKEYQPAAIVVSDNIKSYLSDSQEQVKNLTNSDHSPVIVIKKKRKILVV